MIALMPRDAGHFLMEHPVEHVDLSEYRIDGQKVFDGKLLQVYQDRVVLPDRNEGSREYIKHPGAVVILAIQNDGRLLVERQFRYPLGQAFLELPAGKIEPGEDILNTAKRELFEETGHESDDWSYLGKFHPCIGYSTERIEIFIAKHIRKISEPALDEGEFLEVFYMSLEEINQSVASGYLTDGKTLSALYVYACHNPSNVFGVIGKGE
jgi:ADP-ribose pyrophosphatase